jgi:hypothetical protein
VLTAVAVTTTAMLSHARALSHRRRDASSSPSAATIARATLPKGIAANTTGAHGSTDACNCSAWAVVVVGLLVSVSQLLVLKGAARSHGSNHSPSEGRARTVVCGRGGFNVPGPEQTPPACTR